MGGGLMSSFTLDVSTDFIRWAMAFLREKKQCTVDLLKNVALVGLIIATNTFNYSDELASDVLTKPTIVQSESNLFS